MQNKNENARIVKYKKKHKQHTVPKKHIEKILIQIQMLFKANFKQQIQTNFNKMKCCLELI